MAKPLAYDQKSVKLTDSIGLWWNVDLCHKYWFIWPNGQKMVKHWSMVKVLTYTNIGQLWKSWPMVKNLTYGKSMSSSSKRSNVDIPYGGYIDIWWISWHMVKYWPIVKLLTIQKNGQILTHGENLDIWWKHLNLWLNIDMWWKYWPIVKLLTNGENSVQLSRVKHCLMMKILKYG